MSDWSINLPVRDRHAPITDIGGDARALDDPAERAMVRQLVLGAMLEGDTTSGDLLDRLEAADPTARRKLFDDAREAAGRERSEDIDECSLSWPRPTRT
jgi:hypothetical protein